MDIPPPSRRRVMKSALSAAAGVHLFNISGTRASGQILGANDRLRVGVCGLRNRGAYHLSAFLDQKNVEVATLIDVDESQFGSRQRQLRERTGREAPRIFNDIRWALEDPDLDIISIATCNHTHALYTILACQAGKDVYVEMPISHHMEEGRQIIAAAQRYRRIVQHGSQLRSSPQQSAEIAAIRSGQYGKLKTAKAINERPFVLIPPTPPRKPPPDINWDTWIGPAHPERYRESLHRNNWRYFWAFGNGVIGDLGMHQLDVARWAIDRDGLPSRVWALGGSFPSPTEVEAPNFFLSVFEFGEVSIIFESRDPTGKTASGSPKAGNEYHTADGVIRNGHFFPSGSQTGEPLAWDNVDRELPPGGAFYHFVSAVRNRDPSMCQASPEVAHQSCALCHLANTAYRIADPVSFLAGQPHQIRPNSPAEQSFERISHDLTARGLNLATMQYRLSPVLTVDLMSEKFTGDHAGKANQMIQAQYRAPWTLPEFQ